MKKASFVAVLALAGLSLTGCMSKPIVANNGFAAVPPGALFSEMKFATQVQERSGDGRNATVVGPVSAEASTVCYLGLISQGDASYATLKAKALRKSGADDIIDLEVDCRHNNILGIVNTVTTEIRGTGVKYVK